MGTPVRLHRYSFQDYLAVEEVSTIKHEYLDGEMYAMGGGSVLHAALSAAVVAALHAQLRGRCRVFSSDLRTRIRATGLASYADATVVCGAVEADPENVDTVTNPTALVEVLSPSTIDYDLGEKFEHYKQAPSVRAVVYVWQDRRRIMVRERRPRGEWSERVFEAGHVASIEALDCRLDVDAIYADAGGP
ncbi:MAG TPA: Uma2 family endonuclease [Vicinamibacterales bacterium]|nr:Uma2 family endonuclease [Vicinamibacterales bacterium]